MKGLGVQMKKKSALLVLITIATMSWGTMVSAEESITIDEANFPDEVFRTYVSETVSYTHLTLPTKRAV